MRKSRCLLVLALLLGALVCSQNGSAISLNDSTLLNRNIQLTSMRDDEDSAEGIRYYDSKGGCGSSSSAGISLHPEDLPEETVALFEAMDLAGKAEQNRDIYDIAAAESGLPWQVFAAIHSREGGMNRNQSLADGEPIGTGVSIDGTAIGDTIEEDARIAGQGVLNWVNALGIDPNNLSVDDVANIFLHYNRGYLYDNASSHPTWRDSPYVMNYLTKETIKMPWPCVGPSMGRRDGETMCGSGGRDLSPGALAIFIYLGGAESLTGGGDSGGSAGGSSTTTQTGQNVTLIGDSISWGALQVDGAGYLKYIPDADFYTKIGKHALMDASESAGGKSAATILSELQAQGKVRDILVIATGANDVDPYSAETLKARFLDVAKDAKKIVFVTTYSNTEYLDNYLANNETIKSLQSIDDRVIIADWAAAASEDPARYINPNDVHLTPDGTELWSKTIYDAIASSGLVGQSNGCCKGDASVVDGVTKKDIDGHSYAFPLAGATKENYMNPEAGKSVLSRLPCASTDMGACHHNYYAVDMGLYMSMVDPENAKTAADFNSSSDDLYFYATGTPVVAITSGTITSYGYYSSAASGWQDKCASVNFAGDDGYNYWLGHMYYEDQYKTGDHFEAGEVIGHIGPSMCTNNGSQAHLHIDNWFLEGKDPSRGVHIVTLMNELYEALPESSSAVSNSSGSSIIKGDKCNGSTGLKSGGMTHEEAQAMLDEYWSLPGGADGQKWSGLRTLSVGGDNVNIWGVMGCAHGSLGNCVAFSQYFANRFTTKPIDHTANGRDLVDAVLGPAGWDTGTEPRPYSIYSTNDAGVGGNHTGVVVYVNKDENVIRTAEAGCSHGNYWVGEYTYDGFMAQTGLKFAYTDGILKEDKL